MRSVQSLDPRPLEELHHERAYLLHDLQKQGARATRLFHRHAAVEVRLAGAVAATATPAETKKCKKEASLVRAKIAESTQQEQLILLRLGEIHVELQNRDRWMLVHQHQLQQQQQHQQQQQVFSWQPPPPLVYPPPHQPVLSIDEVCCLSPCQERQPQQQPSLAVQHHHPQHDHAHHHPSQPSQPEQEKEDDEKEENTPTTTATTTTDRQSSASASPSADYFSSSCGSGSAHSANSAHSAHSAGSTGSIGSMSMLSPLSPCFTPGMVVFAEDIWARAAASASEAESKEVAVAGEEGREENKEKEKETGTGTGTPMTVMVTTTTTTSTTTTMIEEGGEVGSVGVGRGVVEVGGGEERKKGAEGVVVSVDHRQEEGGRKRPVDYGEVEGGEWTEVGRGHGGCEDKAADDNPHAPGCDVDAGEKEEEEEEEEDTQAWRDKLRRVSLYFPGSLKPKDKRMSLPYLKGMWSRSRRNSLQSTAG
jgi:hypothetical protein